MQTPFASAPAESFCECAGRELCFLPDYIWIWNGFNSPSCSLSNPPYWLEFLHGRWEHLRFILLSNAKTNPSKCIWLEINLQKCSSIYFRQTFQVQSNIVGIDFIYFLVGINFPSTIICGLKMIAFPQKVSIWNSVGRTIFLKKFTLYFPLLLSLWCFSFSPQPSIT